MSDPKGEIPHPDQKPEDELELEFISEPEHATPSAVPGHHVPMVGEGHAAAEEPHPLDALNLNASTDDFQFTGPVEELDFTEPADFTFPAEQAVEHEAVSDSSAEIPAGLEHVLGTGEAATPGHPRSGSAAAGDVAVALAEPAPTEAEAPEAGAEEGPSPKPRRELPAWVHAVEWTAVAVLAVAAVIGLIVSAFFLENADTVTLVVNICCPVMLALIPYALWRSSRRWLTPAVSALYTVLLAFERGRTDRRHVGRGQGAGELQVAVQQGPRRGRQAAAGFRRPGAGRAKPAVGRAKVGPFCRRGLVVDRLGSPLAGVFRISDRGAVTAISPGSRSATGGTKELKPTTAERSQHVSGAIAQPATSHFCCFDPSGVGNCCSIAIPGCATRSGANCSHPYRDAKSAADFSELFLDWS